MKRIIPLLLLCLAACNPDPGPSKPVIVNGGSPEGGKTTRPRNRFISGNNAVTSSVVSLSDISAVLQRNQPITKGHQSSQASVTPYLDDKGKDTLMYIVNYPDDNGWKIFSSDKRTPAVIAEGEHGSFSLEGGSPAVAVWMDCAAKDIARVRRSTDDQLAFSELDIMLNKAFWTGEPVRALGDTIDPFEPVRGHWEEEITSHSIVYDTLGHMVAKWDQDAPYNECCPFLISRPSDRAPAGCVAIAGAQMLLYLHDKIGIPATMYSSGYCNGNINSFAREFLNENNMVWSTMSYDYQEDTVSTMIPEAIMIGFVGAAVDMHYCDIPLLDPFSWAWPSNLKTELFEDKGISCSRGSYDHNIVKTSLLNEMPVIVSATNLMVPVDGSIHCFVIDGYKRTRIEYSHYHYFVVDGNPPFPYQMPQDYYTYTYSSPELTSIRINWGWATQWRDDTINGIHYPLNDGYYSLTSGWTVTDGVNEYDYNYNKYMTYGFEIAE